MHLIRMCLMWKRSHSRTDNWMLYSKFQSPFGIAILSLLATHVFAFRWKTLRSTPEYDAAMVLLSGVSEKPKRSLYRRKVRQGDRSIRQRIVGATTERDKRRAAMPAHGDDDEVFHRRRLCEPYAKSGLQQPRHVAMHAGDKDRSVRRGIAPRHGRRYPSVQRYHAVQFAAQRAHSSLPGLAGPHCLRPAQR